MRIVSACLAGVLCRFFLDPRPDPRIEAMVAAGEALPLCPEQLGGLPTPRPAAAVLSRDPWRVVADNGKDVTREYVRGAEEVARLAKLVGAREAIMRETSPSCGSSRVRVADGEGHVGYAPGEGVATAFLRQAGITVFSDENWPGG